MNRSQTRKIKNAVKSRKGYLDKRSTEISHFQKVLDSFNFLIEKKAVIIEVDEVFLYPELWGINKSIAEPWMKNAYLYMRLKKLIPENTMISFFNIESKELIGQCDGKETFVL